MTDEAASTKKKKKTISLLTFSPIEKRDLLVSWISLSIAFAFVISPVFMKATELIYALPIALVAVGTGFVFHELAHREMAKSFGFVSEFRAWYPGLAIAIGLAIITAGQFMFAAPGATYFYGENVSRKQNGLISIAGPITNILLGVAMMILVAFTSNQFYQIILGQAAMINFWFALFNMIPIYPLDGSKVITWNAGYWFATISLAAILVFFPGILLGLLGLAFA